MTANIIQHSSIIQSVSMNAKIISSSFFKNYFTLHCLKIPFIEKKKETSVKMFY